MEITPMMIYAIGIADNLREVIPLGMLILALITIILMILSADEAAPRSFLKFVIFPLMIVLGLLAALVPNSKTLASMYVIPAVVNNEKIQNIGKNGLESLELLTKQWVKELREDAEKEDK